MSKDNCWEVKKCERQPGGKNVEELGLCPAASIKKMNGVNNGKNGGRVCWVVTGTFCGGKAQGTYAQKIASCLKCEFFKQVQNEESLEFILNPIKAGLVS